MGDLFAPERICPPGGIEVPVSAKSGPVWKPEQPKEAAKRSVPGRFSDLVAIRALERETDVLRLNRNQRHQGSR